MASTKLYSRQMRPCAIPFRSSRRVPVIVASAEPQTASVSVKDFGTFSVKGSVRKNNEDRWDVKLLNSAKAGEPQVFAGVYDGHGGAGCAEWLKEKLYPVVQANWTGGLRAEAAITDAYLAADSKILSVGAGFLGLGERGVGGSKCGATAANVLIFQDPQDSSTKLLTANCGDARVLLIRDGKAVQLTEDHVPDMESERQRIEGTNPNPKMPLVRFVAGTWRVGGLLALSRAFGDAYLKSSLQFEGLPAGSDGYSSGFGVIAQPYTMLTPLGASDTWLVVASDGLFYEMERGGGGGLDNETVAQMLSDAGNAPCDAVAKALGSAAQKAGSTDDITLLVMRLG